MLSVHLVVYSLERRIVLKLSSRALTQEGGKHFSDFVCAFGLWNTVPILMKWYYWKSQLLVLTWTLRGSKMILGWIWLAWKFQCSIYALQFFCFNQTYPGWFSIMVCFLEILVKMTSSPGRQGKRNCFCHDFAVVIKPCQFYMFLVVIGFAVGSFWGCNCLSKAWGSGWGN